MADGAGLDQMSAGLSGKTWQGAKRLCDAKIADAKAAVQDTLRAFKSLGSALLDARSDGASLDQATELACGWGRLEGLVATAAELTHTMAADPLTHVGQGYLRFRRYAPRMLRVLDIEAAGIGTHKAEGRSRGDCVHGDGFE